MQVICIKENPEWKNIHSGRIYFAEPYDKLIVIETYTLTWREFEEHFNII